MKRIFCVLSLSLLLSISLFAEVQKVVLKWDPKLCPQSCMQILEQRLTKASGVQGVEMNIAEGSATLGWNPTIPFSFVPLNYALRWVGIRENDVRVQVKGTVSISGNTYAVISSGDRTRFVLFGPVDSKPNQYSVQYNSGNRPLADETKEKLLKAKQQNLSVTVSGTLFMPYRSPPDPLRLILSDLQVEEPKKTEKSHR